MIVLRVRFVRTFAVPMFLFALQAQADSAELGFAPFRADPLPPPSLTHETGVALTPAQVQLAGTLKNGQLEEAGLIAQREWETARLSYGDKDPLTAMALANLAAVHQRQGEALRAISEFQSAIAGLSAAGDQRDPALIAPWYGLGLSQYQAGLYPDALLSFASALHLNRTNQGLHNIAQLPLLQAVALSHHAMGQEAFADEYQLRRLLVAERSLGAENPAFMEAAENLANWFRITRRPADERRVYAYAIDRVSAKAGRAKDVRMLEPLVGIIRSWREAPQAEMGAKVPLPALDIAPGYAMNLVLGLVERFPDAPAATRAAALMEVGNLHFVAGGKERAFQAWQRARALLPKETPQTARFDQPALLSFRPPQDVPDAKLENVAAPADRRGFVTVEFAVNEAGRVEDLKVAQRGPSDDAVSRRAASELSTALRFARFRPRIQDGKPVRTEDLKYKHSFSYPG